MYQIAKQEFRYWFFSIQMLTTLLLFFGLAFLFTANGIEFQQTVRGGNVLVNSPYSIASLMLSLSVIVVLIAPTFMGNAILKDGDNRFDGILFSTPITKSNYLLGRFSGAFLAIILAASMAPLGMYLGTFWPWAVPETLGLNATSHYTRPFFILLIPILLTICMVTFSVAVLTRRLLFCYLAVLGFLMLYITLMSTHSLPSVLDPFMIETFAEQTQYWTAVERNSTAIHYSKEFWLNRLLWTGTALCFFALAYYKFSFRNSVRKSGRKSAFVKSKNFHKRESVVLPSTEPVNLTFPAWGFPLHIRQCVRRTRFEMGAVLRSKPFLLLMTFCMFLLAASLTDRETLYNVDTYPITRLLIGAIFQALTLALMFVLAFYSGEIIWRERKCRFHEIIDAMPVPNWVLAMSKLSALMLIMFSIIALGIAIALALQFVTNYHDFQLGLYVKRGLLYKTLPYIFLAVLASFFQVLVRNQMIGMVCFGIFMALVVLSRDVLGVEHILLSYGLPDVQAPLSEMNMDSRFEVAGYWARAYWGSIAGILLILCYVFWSRGTFDPWLPRLKKMRAIFHQPFAPLFMLCLIGLLISGGTIFFNTNILNTYRDAETIELISVEYERRFRKYEALPMPKITDIDTDVDLFPVQRKVIARSLHVLENKTSEAIYSIHLTFPIEADLVTIDLEGAGKPLIDRELAYYQFPLDSPMQPGECRDLRFETQIQQMGFPNSRPDTRLVRNGTFISNHQVTPYVGFTPGHMLKDAKARKKHGLDPLPRVPALEDKESHHRGFLRHDSDFINFKTTVSTVVGQTAIAPGYLVDQRKEEGRHYFTYEMDAPIANFYSFVSADYEVALSRWNDVTIEVYYHDTHRFNVERILESVQDSLEYYSQAFGPYQYRQLRILEFPAYRKFAQAFPNTVPFSEGIGFIADVEDPHQIDLPYYVTAHEVAHQWWAHQVMPSKTQGASMLIETLAQYGALMVMERQFGHHRIRKFLKQELDRYLKGRATDASGETPLYRVEKQGYIHYRKGAVIMYALKDYLGEQTVNRALRKLIQHHAYQHEPYPLSTDLIRYLKEEADLEHHSLIDDFMKRITLFDLKMVRAAYSKSPNKNHRVKVTLEALKYDADATGNTTEELFDLPVDIGLFRKHPADPDFSDEDVILLKKMDLAGKRVLEFEVDQKPVYAGIDPYHKLIDRNLEDNIKELILDP